MLPLLNDREPPITRRAAIFFLHLLFSRHDIKDRHFFPYRDKSGRDAEQHSYCVFFLARGRQDML